MPDAVRFHFDPICPWCYQTSRWIHRLVELGEVTVTWALFCLELQNKGSESDEAARSHARSGPGLRTAVLVRDRHGEDAVGAFYAALGRRFHEDDEPIEDLDTIRAAASDAGLDPALVDEAVGDDATWEAVCAEHDRLVEETRSFGVPTIAVEGRDGAAIFGPVISNPPTDDEEAVELWRHVSWLACYPNFSELKRDRSIPPDLEGLRRRRERRAAAKR